MRELEICKKLVWTNEGGYEAVEAVYAITVDDGQDTETVGALEHYGISVKTETDSEVVRAITPNAKEIDEIVRYMAENGVLPGHVRDVLEDMQEGALLGMV